MRKLYHKNRRKIGDLPGFDPSMYMASNVEAWCDYVCTDRHLVMQKIMYSCSGNPPKFDGNKYSIGIHDTQS